VSGWKHHYNKKKLALKLRAKQNEEILTLRQGMKIEEYELE